MLNRPCGKALRHPLGDMNTALADSGITVKTKAVVAAGVGVMAARVEDIGTRVAICLLRSTLRHVPILRRAAGPARNHHPITNRAFFQAQLWPNTKTECLTRLGQQPAQVRSRRCPRLRRLR